MEETGATAGRAVLAAVALALLLAGVIAPVSAGTIADTSGSDSSAGVASLSVQSEEAPRAEAGVDQTVPRNATVLLDATQSWSPGGELVRYEWTVESPLNRTFEPECETESCRLARFRAPEYGTYDVRLAVEDDAGRTQTDAMYVRTEARSPFDVALDGSSGTLVANVSAGNATLANLTWLGGSGVLENRSLSGAGGTYEHETTVAAGETFAVAVRAADGRTVGDTWRAPTDGGSNVPDYPSIQGPTTLTGDATYDEQRQEYVFEDVGFRVETRDWLDAQDVVWSRDGETVSEDGYYVDDFAAGNHSLSATVHFANSDADLDAFDNVGTGVSDSLGVFLDEQSDRVWVRANPKPEISINSFTKTPGKVFLDYKVKEPLHLIENIRVTIGGKTVYQSAIHSKTFSESTSFGIPESVTGESRVTIVAEDTTGLEKSRAKTIEVRDQKSTVQEGDTPSDPAETLMESVETIADNALCVVVQCG